MADNNGSFMPRGPVGVWKAMMWSFKGLRAAWRHESSFRLEVLLIVVLAPVAFVLESNGVERALLIGSLLLVPSAYCVER